MNIKFAQVPSRWQHCVSYTFVCDWVFLFHFTYFENVTQVGAQPYSIQSSLLCAFSFIISVQPTAVLVNKRLNQPKKLHLFKVCRTPFHSFFTEWWNVKLEIIATIVADFPQKLRNKEIKKFKKSWTLKVVINFLNTSSHDGHFEIEIYSKNRRFKSA